MDFKTLLGSELSAQSKSVFAVYSIKEYLDSMKDKLTSWLSGDSGKDVITLSRLDESGTEQCFALTKEQYDSVVNGDVDEVNVKINTLGDTITLSSDEVMNCIKDVSDEIATQGSFLGYCLEKDTVNATEFTTNICTTIKSISSSMVEKYSTLLSGGDSIKAIQSFFATSTVGTLVNDVDSEDGYIGVVRSSDYTGISVWRSAFIQLGNMFSDTLRAVGKAIWGMGNVLEALGKGIYSLTYSLLRVTLAKYYTRFDSLMAPVGIVDVPIMQFKLGTFDTDANGVPLDRFKFSVSESESIYNAIVDRSLWSSFSRYNTSEYLACGGPFPQGIKISDLLDGIQNVFYQGVDAPDEESTVYSDFANIIFNEIFDNVDGLLMPRSIDYFIPGYNDATSGVVLRLGVTDDFQVILQIYCLIPKSYIKEAEHDSDIYLEMVNTFYSSIRFLAKNGYPVMLYWENNVGANTYNACVGNIGVNSEQTFFTPVGLDQDNYDVAAHCRFFDANVSNMFGPWEYTAGITDSQFTYNLIVTQIVHNGLLNYIIRNSKVFKEMNSSEPDKGTLDIGFLWRNVNDNYVYKWRSMGGVHGGFDDTFPTDVSVLPSIINGFFPYLQRCLTKPAIHYQTNAEVGREVAQGLIVLAIAAAAVYVGVKWAKFSKKLRYKAEIAQGYADNMSWTIGANPSKQDLANYAKAKKKSKFLNGLCSSLGITSSSSESGSVFDVCLSIKDQLSSSFGLKEEYEASEEPTVITTSDISDLVDEVKSLTLAVKSLIKSGN